MGSEFSAHLRSKVSQADSERIEAERSRRAGPALDPHALAYSCARDLAHAMFWRAIKNERRLAVVTKDFDDRIKRIEECMGGCETLGEQLDALDREEEESNAFDLDLRKGRQRTGPDNDTLLVEYSEVHSRVRAILKLRSRLNHAQLIERLMIEFPFLEPEQAGDVPYSKPSCAAYIIVGAHYGVCPSTVRDRLTAARKRRSRFTRPR